MRAPAASHGLGHSRYATDFPSPGGSGGRPFTPRSPGPALTPEEQHYCSAYSVQELRTFHCERVRKMPLSGLDPSMLLGFLVRDENDWRDLRMRITDVGAVLSYNRDDADGNAVGAQPQADLQHSRRAARMAE
jgi:cysteine protease ATG4